MQKRRDLYAIAASWEIRGRGVAKQKDFAGGAQRESHYSILAASADVFRIDEESTRVIDFGCIAVSGSTPEGGGKGTAHRKDPIVAT